MRRIGSKEWMGREAALVIEGLEAAGFEAWLVGGCVRDFLMGRAPGDWDLTTNATPTEVMRVFSHLRVAETGVAHGTVTVFLHGVPLEITTYRVDGAYTDHRRPDSVSFTAGLEEDLARRDFTINALAYSPTRGLVDLFHGREDLERGLIRCVGEPEQRFGEDALRILRGLRFSACLGFSMEEDTERAAFAQKELLQGVSAERVWNEFQKLIMGSNGAAAVCRYIDIIGVFIPELLPEKGFLQNNPHHAYDVLTHSALAMQRVEPAEAETAGDRDSDRQRRVCLKVAALLHDIGKPATYTQDGQGVGHFYGHAKKGVELTQNILQRLRVDNATRERVALLVRYHDLRLSCQERMLKRWMNRLSPELLMDLLSLQQADSFAKRGSEEGQEEYSRIRAAIKDLLLQGQCFSLKGLAINGADLLQRGIPQGPEVGRLLKAALRAVISGKVPNNKEEILDDILERNR